MAVITEPVERGHQQTGRIKPAPLAASVQVWHGAPVFRNATGFYRQLGAAPDANLVFEGIAQGSFDNSNGADGAVTAYLITDEAWLFDTVGGGFSEQSKGLPVYFADDNTVQLAATANPAGEIQDYFPAFNEQPEQVLVNIALTTERALNPGNPSGGSGSANLSIGTRTATTLEVANTGGTNATLPLHGTDQAGLVRGPTAAQITAGAVYRADGTWVDPDTLADPGNIPWAAGANLIEGKLYITPTGAIVRSSSTRTAGGQFDATEAGNFTYVGISRFQVWQANGYYFAGQGAFWQELIMFAFADHAATGTWSAADANNWSQGGQVDYRAYTANQIYIRQARIHEGGISYQRNAVGTDGATFNAANWTALDNAAIDAVEHPTLVGGETARIGDTYRVGNIVLETIAAHTAVSPITTPAQLANYRLVSQDSITDFVGGTLYPQFYQVRAEQSDGSGLTVWEATSNRTAGGTFDATEQAAGWREIYSEAAPAIASITGNLTVNAANAATYNGKTIQVDQAATRVAITFANDLPRAFTTDVEVNSSNGASYQGDGTITLRGRGIGASTTAVRKLAQGEGVKLTVPNAAGGPGNLFVTDDSSTVEAFEGSIIRDLYNWGKDSTPADVALAQIALSTGQTRNGVRSARLRDVSNTQTALIERNLAFVAVESQWVCEVAKQVLSGSSFAFRRVLAGDAANRVTVVLNTNSGATNVNAEGTAVAPHVLVEDTGLTWRTTMTFPNTDTGSPAACQYQLLPIWGVNTAFPNEDATRQSVADFVDVDVARPVPRAALLASGDAVLPATYTITGTLAATGLAATLPMPGTYELSVDVRCIHQAAALGEFINTAIDDGTNVYANTERLLSLAQTTDPNQFTKSFTCRVVTTAANQTVRLLAQFQGGTPTAATIVSDANGRTMLTWRRVA